MLVLGVSVMAASFGVHYYVPPLQTRLTPKSRCSGYQSWPRALVCATTCAWARSSVHFLRSTLYGTFCSKIHLGAEFGDWVSTQSPSIA
jgi:hypothetical protein